MRLSIPVARSGPSPDCPSSSNGQPPPTYVLRQRSHQAPLRLGSGQTGSIHEQVYSARNRFTALLLFLAAALLASPPCMDGQNTDKAALEALYNATDGPNWSRSRNWLTDNPISTWEGVVVVAGKVQSLDLASNQLSGSIPVEVGDLSSLQHLFLDENLLSGTIPPQIGNLSSLTTLSLHHNQLSGTIPPQIGNLSSLTSVNLQANQLSGSIPVEVGNLSSLQYLYLQRNQLSGSIPPQIGNLSNLQLLFLDENLLSGSIPAEFGNLSSLLTTYLYGNQLSGTIPPQMGNLSSLRHLSLDGNQLSGTIPPELGDLSSLQDLYLYGNQLSGTIPPELGNLSSLERLALHDNQLSGTIPAKLGDLSNLGLLYLHGNQLSGTIPPELGDLSSLQYLYLHGNQLSGTIPAKLGGLSSLQYLALDGNQLSGTIPPELGDLSSLQYLALHDNQLSGTIPSELEHLNNINRLSFWGNALVRDVPDTLTEVTERTALDFLLAVTSTDDAPWVNRHGWAATSVPLSQWFGVSTDDQGRVTELRLPTNGLSRDVPRMFEALYKMRRLDLSGNGSLGGYLPRGLTRLPQLGEVNIQGTAACAPPDPAFQSWLERIDFRGDSCGPIYLTAGPPILLGVTLDGTTLKLMYDRKPTSTPIPAAGDFTVKVDGSPQVVSNVAIGEYEVVLTLSSAVKLGEPATVSYTAGVNPIKNDSGRAANIVEEPTRIPFTLYDLDMTGDGAINADDALVMTYAYRLEAALQDGVTAEALREILLQDLHGGPGVLDLQGMLRKADAWKAAGAGTARDITADGAIDANDALAMYHAYTLETLLGDGEVGGMVRYRRHLLEALWSGTGSAVDFDLQAMLARANLLREVVR